MSSDRFAHDKFLIEQLVRPIVNLYRVTPLAAGEAPAGGPVAFVRQRRLDRRLAIALAVGLDTLQNR